MGDLLDALRRDASSAQDVCQKRPDVGRTLRAAKGDDENRVEHPAQAGLHVSGSPIIACYPRALGTRIDRAIVWAISLVIFAGSFLIRFLELQFHNDHFEFISLAADIVHGAVPGVDFFDPTRPLQYYLSAAGLWLFGHQLLAEALLSVTLISIGTALVFVAGYRLSHSLLLGVIAAVFVGAMLPRLYSYPKVIIPAVSLLAYWRFVDAPAWPRLAAVCVATAVSFYFRFDHGVWVGGALLAAIAVQFAPRWRPLSTYALVFAGGVTVLCAPFVMFLMAKGSGVSSGPGTGRLTHLLRGDDVVSLGLPEVPDERPLVYFRPAGPLATVGWASGITVDQRTALEQRYALKFAHVIDGGEARRYVLTDRSPDRLKRLLADPAVAGVTNVDGEGRVVREPAWSVLRRWLHLPVMESPLIRRDNAAVWLYDALFLTPFAAAALLVVRAVRRAIHAGEAPKVVAAIALSLLFNVFLIRGNLDSRLPDVIVPAAILWAWMLRGPWFGVIRRSGVAPLTRAAAAAVVMVSIWMAVDVYAGSMNQLTATDLFSTPSNAARRLRGTIVELRRDPIEQFAPAGSTGLRALTRYVNRCTAPTDRLLVLGFQPEVFFYADRRIAGGNVVFHANLGAAPAEQELIVERLRRQRVPVAILPVDQAEEIERVYPRVKKYLDGRYRVAKESGFREGRPIRVLVDRNIEPPHVDAELDLPCFTGLPSRSSRERSNRERRLAVREGFEPSVGL
jgi:hypothetical protein